jgi:acetyl esterase/lipase
VAAQCQNAGLTESAPAILRVLADAALPVDRDWFGRVCRRAAGGCVDVVYATTAAELAAAVAEARGAGVPVLLCPGALAAAGEVQAAALDPAGAPLVWLDLDAAISPRALFLDPAKVVSIRGRGLEGVVWAIRSLRARAELPPVAHRYGDGPEHVGDLRVPDGVSPPWPVCVLLHGGGWRERWERDLMDGIAVDLARHGYATWNLEYRRVGPSGGGWPGSFVDVAAGIDHLVELAHDVPLDLDRVAVIGHSAGGHLAVWAAGRPTLPPDAPGASPRLPITHAVPLAGVFDLESSASRGMDELSTIALMGGLRGEHPERYALASPMERLPIGVPQLVVVGVNDRPDLVDDNRRYAAAAAAAGDTVDFYELPDADHFTVIDPTSLTWVAIRERLAATFSPSRATSLEHDKEGSTRASTSRQVVPAP